MNLRPHDGERGSFATLSSDKRTTSEVLASGQPFPLSSWFLLLLIALLAGGAHRTITDLARSRRSDSLRDPVRLSGRSQRGLCVGMRTGDRFERATPAHFGGTTP